MKKKYEVCVSYEVELEDVPENPGEVDLDSLLFFIFMEALSGGNFSGLTKEEDKVPPNIRWKVVPEYGFDYGRLFD